MVKAPEYEAMDEARVSAIPGAFETVFGKEYRLKVDPPHRTNPPTCGPVPRATHHIYNGLKKLATVHSNGHIEVFDESVRGKLEEFSRIIEEEAVKAYNMVKGR